MRGNGPDFLVSIAGGHAGCAAQCSAVLSRQLAITVGPGAFDVWLNGRAGLRGEPGRRNVAVRNLRWLHVRSVRVGNTGHKVCHLGREYATAQWRGLPLWQ